MDKRCQNTGNTGKPDSEYGERRPEKDGLWDDVAGEEEVEGGVGFIIISFSWDFALCQKATE